MSRNIAPKSFVTLTEEEEMLRRTDRDKLLFTSYQGRNCALFLQNDRLVEASFFPKKAARVGAVYIGRVKNIAKNIDACFVEIANGEICFLSMKNASAPYLVNRRFDGRILEGDELLVQVVREAQKTKRASVTARISLANEYIALTTGTTKAGYSLKLSREKKEALKRCFTEKAIIDENGCLAQSCDALLSIPDAEKMEAEGITLERIALPPTGLIVRTKAEELEREDMLWAHFFSLSSQFVRLLYIALHRTCFTCLKEADSLWKTAAASLSGGDHPAEIITDQKDIYEELVREYEEAEGTESKQKIRLYQDSMLSLSKLYSLEKKMEDALNSHVWLKSGGFLVIEPTEALTVIDVNSGKYESGKDADETYRKINREAGEEVARQLRLRNLSGIIIVDFINMQSEQYKKELLCYLKELVSKDRIPTHVVDMTPLGLVEITRKKINKPLKEQFSAVC